VDFAAAAPNARGLRAALDELHVRANEAAVGYEVFRARALACCAHQCVATPTPSAVSSSGEELGFDCSA
jgi:hypothetical protein